MIPILYEKTETAFISNGLGRLRDCISATVVEERNSIYEMDFEYPVDGANYDLIQLGRIVGVTHDDTGDVQPFDIVGYTKPIDGVVTFHCTHVSYRQSYLTVNGTGINTLADAFTRLGSYATPNNPFTYTTDKTSTGYVGAFDGIPKSVRQVLGGVEGSILDTFGGEYEWDRFNVILHSARGQYRNFAIRYGVNMLDYEEECDLQGTYSSCIPYWTDGTDKVVGDKQTSSGVTVTNRDECIPLDVSDKFEDKPTKAQVNAMGLSVMNSQNPTVPTQNIHVEFVRLQDMGEYSQFQNLMRCGLCDTIKVIFPDFNSSGTFKIVKVVWNVLMNRYEEMELGDLSTTLSEALGIDSGGKEASAPSIIEQGTSGIWTYREWSNGVKECWGAYTASIAVQTASAAYGGYRSGELSIPPFPVTFTNAPVVTATVGSAGGVWINNINNVTTTGGKFYLSSGASSATADRTIYFHVIGI